MTVNADADLFLSNVIGGLARVAELIRTIPEEKRVQALEAAEQSYFKTARELGYDAADAREWAAAVMSHLPVANLEEPNPTI